MGLLAELKRRNVIRVGLAYLVLGWVVTQVTATIAPALHLPAWTLTLVVWIGVVCFPFVMLFSWVYELTPEGLKRERDIDRDSSITHLTARRLDYLIIAMLAVAIGLFAFDRFGPQRSTPAAVASTATQTAPRPAAPAAPAAKAAVPVDDKSIAVLPFVNMSSDPEQEYFSDGLSEELLNLLAKIPELRVIARTSSFAFKGKEVDIATVADKLKVAHVLEGSVRKSGDRVRITAQLIRAGDSSHLWSETWDRTLDDVFAIQDEIAAAVVAQLKVQLLGAAPKATHADPQAYALYLQARALFRQGSKEGYEKSLEKYLEVVKLDPQFAAAWFGQIENYLRLANIGARPLEQSIARAQEAAQKALKLDPDFAPSHAALGRIALLYENDLQTAAQHLNHALALAPDDFDVLRNAATLSLAMGKAEQAIALHEYLTRQDPVDPHGYSNLGNSQFFAGHTDLGIAAFRNALSLSPTMFGPHYGISTALLHKGDAQAALAEIKLEPEAGGWAPIALPMIHHALGNKAEADAAMETLVRELQMDSAYNIAYVYAYRDETDLAFQWLDRAVAQRDGGLIELLSQPFLATIRDDPRWLPLMEKLGRSPEQLAAITFDAKPPN